MQLPLLPLTPLLLSSDLHCVMQLPLPSAALLSSISPPPISTAWCSFLFSSLICSSPPSNSSAAISTAWCSSLSSPALLSSAAWCSFLSSLLRPISLLRCSPLRDAASSAALLHLLRCMMQNSFLSSISHLLSCSPLRDAASSPLSSTLLLHSPFLLPCSSSLLLHHSPLPPLLLRSPFLLFSLPFFFLFQAPGLGYPVPICHPNFIKDWLANWHKSVGLMSDQHWSEFGDHYSCIWSGEETSYYMS